MKNIALIFPGQGAQKVGMGKELYESSPEAKAIFDKADEIIGNNLKQVIFEGPQETLTSTAFCQPAIVTMCVAALETLKAHDKFKELTPKYAAGLSLGEYSALVACGALSIEEVLALVQKRSAFMDEATKLEAGGMAAIIGMEAGKIKDICDQTGAQVANYNSTEQIVITGHKEKVEEASELIKEAGAKNVIALDVSGAFHSSLMQPAADKFKEELSKIEINEPQFPLVGNVDALATSDPNTIKENLAKQITSSVQWVSSVQNMIDAGIDTFIEIGPGRVLKGLMRKINADVKVFNIATPADIEKIEI